MLRSDMDTGILVVVACIVLAYVLDSPVENVERQKQ